MECKHEWMPYEWEEWKPSSVYIMGDAGEHFSLSARHILKHIVCLKCEKVREFPKPVLIFSNEKQRR